MISILSQALRSAILAKGHVHDFLHCQEAPESFFMQCLGVGVGKVLAQVLCPILHCHGLCEACKAFNARVLNTGSARCGRYAACLSLSPKANITKTRYWLF